MGPGRPLRRRLRLERADLGAGGLRREGQHDRLTGIVGVGDQPTGGTN